MLDDHDIQMLIAQFEALRAEIARRSEAQANVIQLAITAIAALAGLAFAKDTGGDKRLLLPIPLVVTCLGLVWCDHSANIRHIGGYLRDSLHPLMKLKGKLDEDWETFIQAIHSRASVMLRTLTPPLLIFVVVPALAIVGSWKAVDHHDCPYCYMVCGDMLLICLSLAYFWPLCRPRSDSS